MRFIKRVVFNIYSLAVKYGKLLVGVLICASATLTVGWIEKSEGAGTRAVSTVRLRRAVWIWFQRVNAPNNTQPAHSKIAIQVAAVTIPRNTVSKSHALLVSIWFQRDRVSNNTQPAHSEIVTQVVAVAIVRNTVSKSLALLVWIWFERVNAPNSTQPAHDEIVI